MTKELVPLFNGVLLLPLDDEKISPGGIHMPATAKSKTRRARVIAVGEGTIEHGVYRPVPVNPGAEVLIPSDGLLEIEHEGTKYILARDTSVLARICAFA